MKSYVLEEYYLSKLNSCREILSIHPLININPVGIFENPLRILKYPVEILFLLNNFSYSDGISIFEVNNPPLR